MQYYHKQANMICFDSIDLEELFGVPIRKEIQSAISTSVYSAKDLLKDKAKIKAMVDNIKMLKNNDDIEIFAAIYSFLEFYPNAKICFPLKRGVARLKKPIQDLGELKKNLEKDDITDFGFMTDVGLRAFQLKAYRNGVTTDELFDYIKNKLQHYGNNMGSTNLLILLQAEGSFKGSVFKELHEKIMTLSLKGRWAHPHCLQ